MLWVTIPIVSAVLTHTPPSDRIARTISVSSPVISQDDLRQGQLLLLKFAATGGFASILGTNYVTYITDSNSVSSSGSSPLLSLGRSTPSLEIVALADTRITTVAFFTITSCTQIEWISAGSRTVSILSPSDRFCFVSASLTGSVTISGSVGQATLGISGLSGSQTISVIPQDGLKFNLSVALLIQFRTDFETNASVVLNFESTDNISVAVPDLDRQGFYNGSSGWVDFVAVDGEPVYPPLSGDSTETSGPDRTGIVVGGSLLFAVVVIGVSVRLVVGDDYYCLTKRRFRPGTARPRLTPVPDAIPADEDAESALPVQQVESAKGTVVDACLIPDNPYEKVGSVDMQPAGVVL